MTTTIPPRPFLATMNGRPVLVTAHTFGADGTDDRTYVSLMGGGPEHPVHTHDLRLYLGARWSAMTFEVGSEEIESACWHSILPVKVRR